MSSLNCIRGEWKGNPPICGMYRNIAETKFANNFCNKKIHQLVKGVFTFRVKWPKTLEVRSFLGDS
jgi:hypothetical protein